ncbi:hypothetical protein RJ639_026984, partial [Escallonia herrerae]
MSNSTNPPDQELEIQPFHQSPDDHIHSGEEEWESMARAWLSTLPDGRTVTPADVEAWLQSNQGSLPDHEQDGNQVDNPARFQRTDQWMPIYSWLESIDSDEVIKSNEILDWLSKNPEVKEDLYSRHSRYHLMHYIKKCHMKILKRKERKKGIPITTKENPTEVHKSSGVKLPVPRPCSNLKSLPTDSDIYLAKRNEAVRKYEILVEMEKQLSALFPKLEN